jgi:hypothetical protein
VVAQYYNSIEKLTRDENNNKLMKKILEKSKKQISQLLFDDAEIIFSTLSGAGM